MVDNIPSNATVGIIRTVTASAPLFPSTISKTAVSQISGYLRGGSVMASRCPDAEVAIHLAANTLNNSGRPYSQLQGSDIWESAMYSREKLSGNSRSSTQLPWRSTIAMVWPVAGQQASRGRFEHGKKEDRTRLVQDRSLRKEGWSMFRTLSQT